MKYKNLKIKGIAVVLVAFSMFVFSCKETPKEQSEKDGGNFRGILESC